MVEVTRYNLAYKEQGWLQDHMREDPKGDFMYYDDHDLIVTKLQAGTNAGHKEALYNLMQSDLMQENQDLHLELMRARDLVIRFRDCFVIAAGDKSPFCRLALEPVDKWLEKTYV